MCVKRAVIHPPWLPGILTLCLGLEVAVAGCSDDAGSPGRASGEAGAAALDGAAEVRSDGSRPAADAAADAESVVCLPLGDDDRCDEDPTGGTVLGQPDAGGRVDGGTADVSCDPAPVLCKRAPPVCPTGEVPAVVDTCWGDCVRVDRCACYGQSQCPEPERYACHMSAAHCGPYVN
ncbi:MAG: Kazal-type serine protease inhibitor domain protein [Myxococcaceae bacterium]|nr:Kazal-type serine protease inhibitor domain protein [Myxococcaceae bacterium]